MQKNSVLWLFITLFAITIDSYAIGQFNPVNQCFKTNLERLEKNNNGHIALSIIDLNNNQYISYHGNEVIPMQCTSKVIGVAKILKQSMQNPTLLNERIFYSKKDLTNWTPITQKHVADGMTIAELSQAAIEYSDNTAMNLLVKKAGGLDKINQFAHNELGNETFRQDHGWPKEAYSIPGGVYDTSTTNDMANSLNKLLFGNVLGSKQKTQLQSWMNNCKTGDNRIRKGIPRGWKVGDKTGSGIYYGITNDLAVIYPPQCKPIILAIYYYSNSKKAQRNETVLKDVTKVSLQELALTNKCIANNTNSTNN